MVDGLKKIGIMINSLIKLNQSVLSGPSNQSALFRATLRYIWKCDAVFLELIMNFLGVIMNAEKLFKRELKIR